MTERNKEAPQGWNGVFARQGYDLTRPNARLVERIRNLRQNTTGAFLDLGCGLGRHLAPLADTGVCVGLDISRTALAASREAAAPPAHLVLGHMACLPFPDQVFGTVLAWRSLYLQTTDDIDRTIAEIHRVLVPGGVVLASVRAVGNALEPVVAARGQELEPHTYEVQDSEFPGVVYHFFTQQEVRHRFADFDIQELNLTTLTHTPATRNQTKPNSFHVLRAQKPAGLREKRLDG